MTNYKRSLHKKGNEGKIYLVQPHLVQPHWQVSNQ